MAVTPEAFQAAVRRGARASAENGAISARYDVERHLVRVVLQGRRELQFSPVAVQELRVATEQELVQVRLSPSRLGLYFPALDVDLSISNLLQSEDGQRFRVVRI